MTTGTPLTKAQKTDIHERYIHGDTVGKIAQEFKKGILSSGIVINTSGGSGKIEGLPKSDASEAFRLMRQYWQAYREGR